MTAHRYEQRDGHLALGLVVGAVVGAGLAVWFAPHRSAWRQRLKDSLRIVRDAGGARAAAGEPDDEHLRQDEILRNDIAQVDADADALDRAAGDGLRDVVPATTEPVTAMRR
jgi:hypothetical protein